MSQRSDQVSKHIQEVAAEFLSRESNRVSLITVTNVSISKDFKRATVYFTVYPETHETQALHFARRKRSEFKEYLKKRMHSKRIPFVEFEIDTGEKHRQHIDDISREIEE